MRKPPIPKSITSVREPMNEARPLPKKKSGRKWFPTRIQANKALTEERKRLGHKVFKWKHTKRKNPFFVGTELEFLNA